MPVPDERLADLSTEEVVALLLDGRGSRRDRVEALRRLLESGESMEMLAAVAGALKEIEQEDGNCIS